MESITEKNALAVVVLYELVNSVMSVERNVELTIMEAFISEFLLMFYAYYY
jgi:hypothetical protein